MSTEIQVPFILDQHGNVATVIDPSVQAMQHVTALVDTNPGERVMQPDYGIPLSSYLFEPDPTVVTKEITQDVKQQMALWEPSVTVLAVLPQPDNSLGVANVEVDFSIDPAANPTVLTATVEVGGTVVEGASS